MFYKYIVRGMLDNLSDYDWMPEMTKFLYDMNPNYVPQYSDHLTPDQQIAHKRNLENHGKVTSYLATQAIAAGDDFPEDGPGDAPDDWIRADVAEPAPLENVEGRIGNPPNAPEPEIKNEPPQRGNFDLPGARGEDGHAEVDDDHDGNPDIPDPRLAWQGGDDIGKIDDGLPDENDDADDGPEKPGSRIAVALQSPELNTSTLTDEQARVKADELKKMIGNMNREDVTYFLRDESGRHRRVTPEDVVNLARNDHTIIKFLNEDATGRVLRLVRVKKDARVKKSAIQMSMNPASNIHNDPLVQLVNQDAKRKLAIKKKENNVQMKRTRDEFVHAAKREIAHAKPDTSPQELRELNLVDEVEMQKAREEVEQNQSNRKVILDEFDRHAATVDKLAAETNEIVNKNTDKEAEEIANKRIDEKYEERKPFVYDRDDELTKGVVDEQNEAERKERQEDTDLFRQQLAERKQRIESEVARHEEEFKEPPVESSAPVILNVPNEDDPDEFSESQVDTQSEDDPDSYYSSEEMSDFMNPLDEKEAKASTLNNAVELQSSILSEELIDQFSLVNERGFYARAKAKKTLDIIDRTVRGLIGKEAATDPEEAEIEKAAALMVLLDQQLVSDIESLQGLINNATAASFWAAAQNSEHNKRTLNKEWRKGLDLVLQARIHQIRRDAREKRDQRIQIDGQIEAINAVIDIESANANELQNRLAQLRSQSEELQRAETSEEVLERYLNEVRRIPSLDDDPDEEEFGEDDEIDILSVEQTNAASLIRSNAMLDFAEQLANTNLENSSWLDQAGYTQFKKQYDNLSSWLRNMGEGKLHEAMTNFKRFLDAQNVTNARQLMQEPDAFNRIWDPSDPETAERGAKTKVIMEDIELFRRLREQGKLSEAEIQTFAAQLQTIIKGYVDYQSTRTNVEQLKNTFVEGVANYVTPDIYRLMEAVQTSNDGITDIWEEVMRQKELIQGTYLSTRNALIKAVRAKILDPGLAMGRQRQALHRHTHQRQRGDNESELAHVSMQNYERRYIEPEEGPDEEERDVLQYLNVMGDVAETIINLGLEQEAIVVERALGEAIKSAWLFKTGRAHQSTDINATIRDVARVTSATLANRMVSVIDTISKELIDQLNITGVNLSKEEMLEMTIEILQKSSAQKTREEESRRIAEKWRERENKKSNK